MYSDFKVHPISIKAGHQIHELIRTDAGVEVRNYDKQVIERSRICATTLQFVPLDFPSDALVSVIVYLNNGWKGPGSRGVTILPGDNWMLKQMRGLREEVSSLRKELDQMSKSLARLKTQKIHHPAVGSRHVPYRTRRKKKKDKKA